MTVIDKRVFECVDVYGKKEKLITYDVVTTSKKVKNETFYCLKDAIDYCKENGLKHRRLYIYKVA